MLHRLMIGTWTPPGAIFTVVFDDEKRTLELVERTEIAHDEPISWMTFDVSRPSSLSVRLAQLGYLPSSMPGRISMGLP